MFTFFLEDFFFFQLYYNYNYYYGNIVLEIVGYILDCWNNNSKFDFWGSVNRLL